MGLPYLSPSFHLVPEIISIRRLGVPNLLCQPCVEAFAIADGQLKYAIVGCEYHDVARGVENGGTDFTVLKVALHQLFGLGR